MLDKGSKVIDVALQYGYETPESFSKAFTRFHGATPSQAKTHASALKFFHRLTIKIIMEGGTLMEYKIVEEKAFDVVVKAEKFSEDTSAQAISAFWAEFFRQGLDKKLPPDLGICGGAAPEGDSFLYGIGCRAEQVRESSPDFETWSIPAQTWAVFPCVGPMPCAIQNLWKRIYSEWLPQSNYALLPGFEFERYFPGDTQSQTYASEIWLPVKLK